MTRNGAQKYNIAAIRQLLLAAFTPEELRRFCWDRTAFQPLVAEFGPGMGLDDIVDQVIDYCRRKLLWNELLIGVEQVNPRQYAQHEPYHCPPTTTPPAAELTVPEGQVDSAEAAAQTTIRELVGRGSLPAWILPLLLFLCVALAVATVLGINYAGQVSERETQTAVASRMVGAEQIAAAQTSTALADTDGDGLADADEIRLGTDPTIADSDGDGLSDKEEVDGVTDPVNHDTDRDGLSDGDEKLWNTDPSVIDSDGDTLLDGEEVHGWVRSGETFHTSPINSDTDGDGTPDNTDPDPGQLPTATPTATQVTPTLTPTPTASLTPTPTPTLQPDLHNLPPARIYGRQAPRYELNDVYLRRFDGFIRLDIWDYGDFKIYLSRFSSEAGAEAGLGYLACTGYDCCYFEESLQYGFELISVYNTCDQINRFNLIFLYKGTTIVQILPLVQGIDEASLWKSNQKALGILESMLGH